MNLGFDRARRGASVALVALAALMSPQTVLGAAPPAKTTDDLRARALTAGAARIDITALALSNPGQMKGVNDPIYVRALVIGSGRDRAALVTVDTGGIGTETWSHVSDMIERKLGIAANNLILTATHSHSVPRLSGAEFEQKIFEAIKTAAGKAEPARIAWGTGVSYINVNRNLIDPETHHWWEGPNYDGVSDKTVAVLRVEDLKGEPIGLLYNYAVHAVINGQLDQISGDIPGAASRYIEQSLGDDAVALWSEGAAGDQNPIFFQQTYDLRAIRVKDYAKRGQDISNAMPPGGEGLDRTNPRVALLMDQQRQITVSMGQMLGEEVLHTMRVNMERPRTSADIVGMSKTVTCPGRQRTDQGRAGRPGTYVDGPDVPIRLSLLRIGQTIIGGVNAEVFNSIAQRFKRESPYKHTVMATLTNGFATSGYIPNDAAFNYETFEVLSSRLKPGCAETAIVDGLLDLIEASEATAK